MRRKLSLLLCLSVGFWATAQVKFESSNLPIVSINTNNQKIGEAIKIIADFTIRDNPSKINKLSDPITYTGKIGIEARGSTSLSLSKRIPYSIETRENDGKTNKNVALLGMAKENDWALLAPYTDKSLIREAFIYSIAKKQMPWVADFRFVDVFINDKYEGIYMLTEKIKQGKNRVNINKIEPTDISGDKLTGGYIFAFDKFKQGDKTFRSFYAAPNGTNTPEYIVMSPKADKIATQQLNYIRKYMQSVEKILFSSKFNDPNEGYPKVLDVNSFVDYVLLSELSKNVDGYRLSTYFYKDRDSIDTRLHAGPIWDYNIAFGNANYCNADPTSGWAIDFNDYCGNDNWTIHFFWLKLFKDPIFRDLLRKRWQELRKTEYSDAAIKSTISNLQTTIGAAQVTHFQRFPILNEWIWPNVVVKGTYEGEIDYFRQWTLDRAAWLDGALAKFVEAKDTVFSDEIKVFPSPAKEFIHIKLEEQSSEIIDFQLFDALGREIKRLNFYRTSTDVDISQLNNGIYFWTCSKGRKQVGAGKILIQN